MARERPDYRERLAYLREKYNRSFLTVPETAKELGVCARTIKAMIERRCDPLPAVRMSTSKTNRRYLVSLESIARL